METKLCTRGNHEQPVELFSKRLKAKDGLMNWCKTCVATYERERYQNGDRERKERNRARTIERARAFIWDFLSGHPCVDCGESDPIVLQFDHRDDVTKVCNVSEMYGRSVKSIQEEISKCDIRCANCHVRRTAKQFGFWKLSR